MSFCLNNSHNCLNIWFHFLCTETCPKWYFSYESKLSFDFSWVVLLPVLTSKVTELNQMYHTERRNSLTPQNHTGHRLIHTIRWQWIYRNRSEAKFTVNRPLTTSTKRLLQPTPSLEGPILWGSLIPWSSTSLTLMLETKFPLTFCLTSGLEGPATNPNHLGLDKHLTYLGKDLVFPCFSEEHRIPPAAQSKTLAVILDSLLSFVRVWATIISDY